MVSYCTVVVSKFLAELMCILGLRFECVNDPRASISASGARDEVVEKAPNALGVKPQLPHRREDLDLSSVEDELNTWLFKSSHDRTNL